MGGENWYMTLEQFKEDFDAKMTGLTDEELMDRLRAVGCKFEGDEDLEKKDSQEQYKESLKHDY